jgi:hypothetical protein
METHWGSWRYEPVVETRVADEYSAFLVDKQHHLRQSNFNLEFSVGMGAFTDLGGRVHGPPTVCKQDGTLHIFYIGFDHIIYHKQWDGMAYTPENGFDNVDKTPVCSIAAVGTGPGVSVFAMAGVKTATAHHFQWTGEGGWRKVDDLPGEWTGSLSAISDKEGNWDLFGAGLNGARVIWRDGVARLV